MAIIGKINGLKVIGEEHAVLGAKRRGGIAPMDVINGTAGNDNLVDTAINDTLNGLGGNDTLNLTQGGFDVANGGDGSDVLVLAYGAATSAVTDNNAPSVNVTEGGFNGGYFSTNLRVTYTSIERFDITTGTFNDIITTGTGNDTVNTGLGDDLVNVGSGNNTANGGGGTDRLSADFSSQGAGVSINLNNASSSGAFGSFSGFEYFGTITGSAQNDTFLNASGAGISTFNLGAGNDTASLLAGTIGTSIVNGDLGSDTLIIDFSGGGSAVQDNNAPSANGTLGGFNGGYFSTNGRVNYTSIENFNITSGAFNDTITTATGNDTINSGDGDDLINVGAGNNTANGGGGIDRLSADFSGQGAGVSINLNNAVNSGAFGSFSGFEYFGTITGSAQNDSFRNASGAGISTFNLGAGNDSASLLAGTTGTSIVNGDLGSDTLIIDFSAGGSAVQDNNAPSANGTLGGFNGGYFSNTGRVSYTSIENFNITSGAFNDTITTATGNDTISSGDGDDLINVGAGNNAANGGGGTDRLSADFSGQGAAVSVNLNNGSNSGAFGSFSNFEYFGTVTGSDFDDVFLNASGAGVSTFNLGEGNDIASVLGGTTGTHAVNGDEGSDTLIVDFSAGGSAVTDNNAPAVNLTVGGFNGGYFSTFGRVSYTSVERFDITTATGDFDDIITTATGNDTVSTGDGDDLVNVGAGDNTANGGAGVDRLSADFSGQGEGASIDLNDATNSGGYGSFSNFEYFGAITGTGFDDVFVNASGVGASTFNLGVGNDSATVLAGTTSTHAVNGDVGSDTLVADFSAASSAVTNNNAPQVDANGGFFGGYFSTNGRVNYTSIERFDITTGTGAFNDAVTTATGNDRVKVFAGDDVISLGAGLDTLVIDYSVSAAAALVTLTGPTANATLGGFDGKYSTDATNEVAYTSADRFEITGGTFNDTIVTATGNDIIDGGAGADSMTGGAGNDIYFVDNAGDVVVEGAGGGTDEIRTTRASFSIAALAEIENLTGLSASGQSLTGNAGNNVITGSTGNDTLAGQNGGDTLLGGDGNDSLNGGGGNDSLTGGAGNDTMRGETGNDTMAGGANNDLYFVEEAGDVVTESAGGGTDEIRTTLASYSLAAIAEVENLTGTSATGQSLTGNALNNRINGGAGNDTLNGGGGKDQLNGGDGTDNLKGGAGGDRLIMTAGGDALTGAGGNDTFVLTDNFTAADRARIQDFAGNDRIEVGAADFGGGLTAGALDADAFLANTTGQAEDAEDRFIYDTDNGRLFYDADGAGGADGLLIAILNGAPTIDASDFLVI